MRASTAKTTTAGRGHALRRTSGRRGAASGSWVKTSKASPPLAEALPPRGEANRLKSLLTLDVGVQYHPSIGIFFSSPFVPLAIFHIPVGWVSSPSLAGALKNKIYTNCR